MTPFRLPRMGGRRARCAGQLIPTTTTAHATPTTTPLPRTTRCFPPQNAHLLPQYPPPPPTPPRCTYTPLPLRLVLAVDGHYRDASSNTLAALPDGRFAAPCLTACGWDLHTALLRLPHTPDTAPPAGDRCRTGQVVLLGAFCATWLRTFCHYGSYWWGFCHFSLRYITPPGSVATYLPGTLLRLLPDDACCYQHHLRLTCLPCLPYRRAQVLAASAHRCFAVVRASGPNDPAFATTAACPIATAHLPTTRRPH